MTVHTLCFFCGGSKYAGSVLQKPFHLECNQILVSIILLSTCFFFPGRLTLRLFIYQELRVSQLSERNKDNPIFSPIVNVPLLLIVFIFEVIVKRCLGSTYLLSQVHHLGTKRLCVHKLNMRLMSMVWNIVLKRIK